MDKDFGNLSRQALVFAFVVVATAAGLPFLLLSTASFMGRDVSQVAAGVISYYPWAAVGEAAKILGLSLLVGLYGGTISVYASLALPRRWRLLCFPCLPIAAYLAWLLGTALKYPALFEEQLPGGVKLGLFRASFRVSPLWLFTFAAAVVSLLSLAAVVVIWRRWSQFSRVQKAWPVAICLAVCGAEVVVWRRPLAPTARPFPAGGLAAALPPPVPGTAPPANILFIGIDSLRLDRLGDQAVTPQLSALSLDPNCVVFRDHYVGVPRTFPSWIEMITGQQAARTGIRHMFPGFGEREKPFLGWVSQLRAAGYHTAMSSDFAGDIFPRFEAGFDEVLAPKLTLMTLIRQSLDQAFVGLLPLMATGPWRRLFPALEESAAFGDAEHLGLRVRARLAMPRGGGPWLEALFFSTAHFPYAAPYPYYSLFAQPEYSGSFLFQKNPDLSPGTTLPPAEDIAQVRALYNGAVRSIDDEVGRILRQLKESGEWDKTLVVVTADHGEDLYEIAGIQGHGEQLRGENVLRVPLLMKLPAANHPALNNVLFTTRSIDLGTTMLSAAGVPAVVGAGTDLMPWIVGRRRQAPVLAAYAETGLWFARSGKAYFQQLRLDYPGISGLLSFDQGYTGEIVLNPVYQPMVVAAKHRTWIDGDYKLIYMPTPGGIHYELYDRRRDPTNSHDLAATEPQKLQVLKAKLLAYITAQEGPKAVLRDEFLVPR